MTDNADDGFGDNVDDGAEPAIYADLNVDTGMDEPPSLALPLVSSVPNEAVASMDVVVFAEPDDADDGFGDIVDDGDEPTIYADINVDTGVDEPPSPALPLLTSSVPNEAVASIDVVVPAEPDDADDGFGDSGDDGDEPTISAANVE